MIPSDFFERKNKKSIKERKKKRNKFSDLIKKDKRERKKQTNSPKIGVIVWKRA